MCFSQFAQYAPRPVKHHDYDEYEYTVPVRPEGAPPSKAELDDNLFGPKPTPPEWQERRAPVNDHSHSHSHEAKGTAAAVVQVKTGQNGSATKSETAIKGGTSVTSVTTQTVEAVVVELSNGAKLLICPL